MVGEEKRMNPILLIAPVLAKSGPFSLFSSLVTALPTFPSHFVRSGAGASTRQSACHASSARDPRYVEISADLSSKLDRVLPSWGPSRARVLLPCWPPTPIENNGSQPFFSKVADSTLYDYDCEREWSHGTHDAVSRALKGRGSRKGGWDIALCRQRIWRLHPDLPLFTEIKISRF